MTYQGRRKLQKWKQYALINLQLNSTNIADGNEIKKITFVFSLPYSLAVHICCQCQCHKCTLHTMSAVCIHETDYLLFAGFLKARC
jgi:hypothetical protein